MTSRETLRIFLSMRCRSVAMEEQMKYSEPAFQIGTTPMRALDIVLPERRVWERRSVQEALTEADRRHSERRFDSRPITGWGDFK